MWPGFGLLNHKTKLCATLSMQISGACRLGLNFSVDHWKPMHNHRCHLCITVSIELKHIHLSIIVSRRPMSLPTFTLHCLNLNVWLRLYLSPSGSFTVPPCFAHMQETSWQSGWSGGVYVHVHVAKHVGGICVSLLMHLPTQAYTISNYYVNDRQR